MLAKMYSVGYERMINDLIANTNDSVLKIIPKEHNFDFHRGTGGTWRTK
jgi:hypothetical protein